MNILRSSNSSKKELLANHINIHNLLTEYTNSKCRLSKFIYVDYIGEIVLLYNTITGAFFEISRSELEFICSTSYKKVFISDYKILIEHYFVLPEDFNEEPIISDIILERLYAQKYSEPKTVNSYVIFTTLDCNAQCFYCYEKGTAGIKMSKTTANNIADFIINRFKKSQDEVSNTENKETNNKVTISWFGGEPLYNTEIIDIIIDRLISAEIPYQTSIISNGSLINEEIIDKFVNKWKIQNIQITIDGTPTVYNKIKNYKDPEFRKSNPFNTVINNIKLLISTGIKVNIRLNVGTHNADDLMELIKLLNNEIGNPSNFTVYAHRLFDNVNGHIRTEDEHKELCKKLEQVNMFLHYYGYIGCKQEPEYGINEKYCMADGESSLCISPTGKLTICEHYYDDYIIGDIYMDPKEYDRTEIDSWKDRTIYENCKNCCLYTLCLPLKKCADTDINCTKDIQNYKIQYFGHSVRFLYYKLKTENSKNQNNMIENELNRIANEMELSNDYKSLTLWERIKLLFGSDVYRDPHKRIQDNFNGKS